MIKIAPKPLAGAGTMPSGPPKPSWMSLFRTARASIGVLTVAAIGLLVPPQTADELAALSNIWTGLLPGMCALHVSLALLSVLAWYWARAALSARFGLGNMPGALVVPAMFPANPTAFIFVPRLLFGAGVLLGFVLLFRGLSFWYALSVLVWAVPGYGLIHWRGKLTTPKPFKASARQKAALTSGGGLYSWMTSIAIRVVMLLRCAPFGLATGLFVLVLAVAAFVAGAVESFVSWPPDHVGWAALVATWFPGPSVALVGLALMIAPITVATFALDTLRLEFDIGKTTIGLRRPPFFLFLLADILIAPYVFSLHTVRVLPVSADTPTVAQRKPVANFFQQWLATCAKDPDRPVRPVIVAVAGGASRAAIWAASVLAAVDQEVGGPNTAVFAVSSVSGGSLGAAAYMAVLSRLSPAARCGGNAAETLRGLTNDRLGGDALGPTLAGALLGDIPRALLSPIAAPIRWWWGIAPRGGDRAEALERAFEHLWDEDIEKFAAKLLPNVKLPSFADSFLSLFYDKGGAIQPGMPVWIANGTTLQTGARMVTVPFDSVRPEADKPLVWLAAYDARWPFHPAFDALGILDADVPISTAINNSARFPYLEPSGELSRATSEPRQLRDDALELLDGGYFENEGLLTALELATWLKRKRGVMAAQYASGEGLGMTSLKTS
jgi:hypothetical protein